MSHVQVTVPSLQSRCRHSATAFSLNSGLTEITLFGGFSEWPSNLKSHADFTPIANTTVLRFGEYTSCISTDCYSMLCQGELANNNYYYRIRL